MEETALHSERLQALFEPVFNDIVGRSTVTDRFVDRDLYQICITTLWANVVLDPEDVGIAENDLEALFDVVNAEVSRVLGPGNDLKSSFRFINGKLGERAMQEAQLTKNHKDLLLYFSSMMLDPEGHRQWMAEVRENLNKSR